MPGPQTGDSMDVPHTGSYCCVQISGRGSLQAMLPMFWTGLLVTGLVGVCGGSGFFSAPQATKKQAVKPSINVVSTLFFMKLSLLSVIGFDS